MPQLRKLAALSLCATSPILADYLGPRYVPPVDLSSENSLVAAAWKNATSTIEEALNSGNANSSSGGVDGLKDVTFSLGMFSLHDSEASALQFHHTSAEIAASNGTHKVDGDSVYRVASITKVFTVLTMMLNLNSSDWEMSLVDVFPALAEFSKEHPGEDDPIYTIQWDKITLSNLAAQIAGIPTNLLVSDIALTTLLAGENPTVNGFPMVDVEKPQLVNAIPALGQFLASEQGLITTANFIPMIEALLPNFLPWGHPVYSNNGFVLLTAAIAEITGQNISALAQKSILDPLGMTSSLYDTASVGLLERGVIVSDVEWLSPGGITLGSGGLASTINDLSNFGISVLNSTLLPEVETRRWLKPVSNTARFEFQMGRPWEILRYTHDSGAVTDLYTKAGDSGAYSSHFVLLPDYNAGFVILGASSIPTKNSLVGILGDILSSTLLPALEAQAALEAEINFAGTYTSSVEGLKSSVSLCLNKTEGAAPGLLITSFVANGTEMSKSLPFYYRPGARLVPSIFTDTGKVAFRVATGADAPSVDISKTLFSGGGKANFLVGDAQAYGGASVSQWVFDVKDNGEATSASPTFLQDTWKKGPERVESC